MKLNNFDIRNNFWEVNGNFLMLEDFKKLHEEDKTKGKKASSDIMWAVSLLLHPDSILFNLDFPYRKRTVADEYFKDPKLTWEAISNVVAAYEKLVLTSGQRQLVQWARIMDEKTEFLKSIKYNMETYEDIEKMLKSNTALYSELERISDLLAKEGSQGDVKGGAEESASEKGII